jgi:hypothetical protein
MPVDGQNCLRALPELVAPSWFVMQYLWKAGEFRRTAQSRFVKEMDEAVLAAVRREKERKNRHD